MVTKRLYLQIGAQKKARFFSLMYFCESLCINRISHNYVIPQFLFCIIMPFRTSFHIPFRKLFPPFTLTAEILAARRQTQVDSESDLNNVSKGLSSRIALWWINIKDAHFNEGKIYKLENF